MDGELKHYGVLGMKWGVRKDRKTGERKHADKAYSKASNKLRKLDAKISKANTKTAKALDKYEKRALKTTQSDYKSVTSLTNWGRKRNEKKYSLNRAKEKKAEIKYTKAMIKTEKTSKKAQNWYKQMEKTFSEIKLNNVSQADIDLGKTYAAIILEADRKGGSRTDWKRNWR